MPHPKPRTLPFAIRVEPLGGPGFSQRHQVNRIYPNGFTESYVLRNDVDFRYMEHRAYECDDCSAIWWTTELKIACASNGRFDRPACPNCAGDANEPGKRAGSIYYVLARRRRNKEARERAAKSTVNAPHSK